MSGHPSFIPKAGSGSRRSPGGHGHGHGPGGHGPAARMMGGEKALAFGPTMKRMLAFMGQFKGRLLLVLLFAIASTAFSIVGPKVLSEATTVLFDGAVASAAGTGSIDFDAIGQHPSGDAGPVPAVGGVLVGAVLGHELHLAADVLPAARRRCKKIDRVPFGYFEKTSTGDTLSRITNDVDTLGQASTRASPRPSRSAVTVVGVLVMMLYIDWIMTLVALVMVPVSMALVAVVVRLSQKHFVAQQRLLGVLNGRVEETFSGHAVVRAFGREDETVRAYEADNEALYNAGWKAQFLSGLMMPVLGLRGESGVRGRRRHRGVLRRGRHHHRGRHPGLRPVREKLHAAHQPSWPRSPTCCSPWPRRPSASSPSSICPRCRKRPPPWIPRRFPPTWNSTACALATRPMRPSSATSPLAWLPGKPWPSSAPRAPARPPW